MKLTGERKKKGNKAADKAEANGLVRQTDVTLTDEELEKVAGGVGNFQQYAKGSYVRDGDHIGRRRVADLDAAACRRSHVDVVDADAVAAEDLKLLARFEHGGGDLAAACQHRVAVPDEAADRRFAGVRREYDLAAGLQDLDARRIDVLDQ